MKILIIAVFIFIIGCAPTITEIPGQSVLYNVDLAKYSKKGFLFTPYNYDYKYQSIGLVSLVAYSEGKVVKPRSEISSSGKVIIITRHWEFVPLKLEGLIDQLYLSAKEMGADAVIEFKIKAITKQKAVGNNEIIDIPGIELSGFAIDRE